nr:HlyC/CorC family transporter [Clostridia bacterium]
MGGQLILQVVLIAINAFFAMTETACISINKTKLESAAKDGDKKAARLLKMVENPNGFLATIQIGITLAGFLGSAFAAENFSDVLVDFIVNTCGITAIPMKVLDTAAVVVITLILSFFTLVLGELVPKRVALKKADAIASAVCGIIIFLANIFKPVIWLTSVSTNGVLRLMGINPNEEEEEVSQDEIRMMIDIGEETGTIDPTQGELIDNIFEFNNLLAGDVMTHRTDMATISIEATNDEITEIIRETGFSRFPVYGKDIDEIIGVLRTREFLLNIQSPHPKALKDMLAKPHFVPETVRADVLFRDMQAKKRHMAIVVDEYGGTSGLITMEDLLEEIVGNIYDESDDKPEPDIVKLEDNLWRVSGSVDIDELAEAIGIDLDFEDEDYGTLGGLVYSQLSQIPEDGSNPEIEAKGMHVKVERISEHRVV